MANTPRGNYPNAGHYYNNLFKPVKIDVTFTVNSTDTGGLGVTSVKSNGYVNNVFMHTSATPGSHNGATNPNAAHCYAIIQMTQNFNAYIGGFTGFISPVTGSEIAVHSSGSPLTVGQPYVITTLGTSTLADWQAVGLPQGLTPTVGQSFIATSTGHGTGTGKVKVPGVSGITSMEVIANPNTEIANSSTQQNGGAYIMIQFLAQSSAFTYNSDTPASSTVATTSAPANPADGTIVNFSAFFDASSVTIDGL